MIIELDESTPEWEFEIKEGEDHANVLFASASSPDNGCLEIYRNDELIDKVYLKVPHSWWPGTNQHFLGAEPVIKDEKVLIKRINGTIALRIDLQVY